jgi:chitinase
MRNKFLFLCLFLFGTLTACKDTKWVDVPTGTPPDGAVTGKPGEDEPDDPDDPTEMGLINCSYIRGDFYDFGRISGKSMATCNDLIFLTCRPYADGSLAFELPDAKLTGNATYTAEKDGKNGVLYFNGSATMNAGDGLLHSPDGPSKQFTFGTYIYIEEWVANAYLFKKATSSKTIAALQLGDATGKVKLTIGDYSGEVTSADLTSGTWHYIALSYTATGVKLNIDNKPQINFSGATFPAVPNDRVDFVIGDKFKGYLEETTVWSISAGTLGKDPITYPSAWNKTKVLAYWKYDEAENLGKDSHSWITRLEDMRQTMGTPIDTSRFRLGCAGGQWKDMVKNEGAYTNFANKLCEVLSTHNLDGIDLDFEWPENSSEGTAYSKAIVEMSKIFKKNAKKVFFTVSLHPYYVKYMTEDACKAPDFISLQCYGPSTDLYPLNAFQQSSESAAQKIPKNKLVLGVPFQGTTGTPGEQKGYFDFANSISGPDQTQITYTDDKTYTFDGVNAIYNKTKYACENGYAGIMSWDLANDVDVTNDKSLLKTVQKAIEDYIFSSGTGETE